MFKYQLLASMMMPDEMTKLYAALLKADHPEMTRREAEFEARNQLEEDTNSSFATKLFSAAKYGFYER